MYCMVDSFVFGVRRDAGNRCRICVPPAELMREPRVDRQAGRKSFQAVGSL